ncbi:MAG: hypothetical protein WCA46_20215 [Actinocatenispora sp.]
MTVVGARGDASRVRQRPAALRLLAVLAVMVLGVALDAHAMNVSHDLVERRSRSCDGTLPMPASAYLYAWTGAVLVLAALAYTVVRLARRKRSGFSAVTTGCYFAVGMLAFYVTLFTAFALYAVYADAAPVAPLCSG